MVDGWLVVLVTRRVPDVICIADFEPQGEREGRRVKRNTVSKLRALHKANCQNAWPRRQPWQLQMTFELCFMNDFVTLYDHIVPKLSELDPLDACDGELLKGPERSTAESGDSHLKLELG